MVDLADIAKRLEGARKETEERHRKLRLMVEKMENEITSLIAVDNAFYDCILALKGTLDTDR